MSDEATIIQAAKDHFEAMPDRPETVWANRDEKAATPRVEFQEGPIAQRPMGLDGASDARFLMQVTVVVEADTSTTEADQLAQSVISHFKVGTRISTAQVDKRPERGAPIPDDGEWRIPITIRLRVVLTS